MHENQRTLTVCRLVCSESNNNNRRNKSNVDLFPYNISQSLPKTASSPIFNTIILCIMRGFGSRKLFLQNKHIHTRARARAYWHRHNIIIIIISSLNSLADQAINRSVKRVKCFIFRSTCLRTYLSIYITDQGVDEFAFYLHTTVSRGIYAFMRHLI